MNNKNTHYLTLHFTDCVKEYYSTDCTGKMLEITTNTSNNITKKIINIKELPKEVLNKIFISEKCYE